MSATIKLKDVAANITFATQHHNLRYLFFVFLQLSQNAIISLYCPRRCSDVYVLRQAAIMQRYFMQEGRRGLVSPSPLTVACIRRNGNSLTHENTFLRQH